MDWNIYIKRKKECAKEVNRKTVCERARARTSANSNNRHETEWQKNGV